MTSAGVPKGPKFRGQTMEMGVGASAYTIVNTATQVMTMVNPAERSYYEVSLARDARPGLHALSWLIAFCAASISVWPSAAARTPAVTKACT